MDAFGQSAASSINNAQTEIETASADIHSKITDAKAVMADFDSKKTDLQASIKRIKETLNNVGTDFSQSATSEAPQATSTATVANEQQNASAKSLPKTNETSSPILLSTIGTFFVTLGILLKKRIN